MSSRVKKPIFSLLFGGLFAVLLIFIGEHFIHFKTNTVLAGILLAYAFSFSEEFSKHKAHEITHSGFKNEYLNLLYACIGFFVVEQAHYYIILNDLFSLNMHIFIVRCIFVFLNHIIGSFFGLLSFNYLRQHYNHILATVLGLSGGSLVHFSVNYSFSRGYMYFGALILFFAGYFLMNKLVFSKIPGTSKSLR